MSTILITGANGLLGQFLIKDLLERGFAVVATGKGVNRLPFSEGEKFRYIEMDFTSGEQVRAVLQAVQPAVIVHAGAMTQVDPCELHPEDCYRTNVQGAEILLEGASLVKSRFIFVSTDFIFDGIGGPYREDDTPGPLSVYGRSKWEAEALVRASGLEWAIARTVLVYGTPFTGSRSNIITWVKTNLEAGKRIQVVSDQWRTPTYVEDLAAGIGLMISRKASGTFHLSGKDLLTPYDMAMQVAHLLNLDASLLERVDAATFTQPGQRPAKTGFVIDKAVKHLGYGPVSFEQGILLTLGLSR